MTLTAKKIIETALETMGQEPKFLQGCHRGMHNETYHAIKSFISRSSIMDFLRSPYSYWAKHLNPERPKRDATAAMTLGSAFHTLALEPTLFNEQYVMKPAPMLLKDVGREAYDIYKNAVEYIEKCGKEVISADEYNTLESMLIKLHSNKEAMELIHDSRIENSFFWQDMESGLLLKSRPDILHENVIVDLKTTSDASPRAFQNEMVKYGYHIQFAMIRDAVEAIEGRRINHFINIVIETKYPYNMGIYMIDEFTVDEGQAKYKHACLDLKEAIADDKWDDYGIRTISLPKWAFSD